MPTFRHISGFVPCAIQSVCEESSTNAYRDILDRRVEKSRKQTDFPRKEYFHLNQPHFATLSFLADFYRWRLR